VLSEPSQNSAIKFFRRYLIHSAMSRVGNKPNYNLSTILLLDQVGMIGRNIAIAEAVDEKYRNICSGDRTLRRSGFHV